MPALLSEADASSTFCWTVGLSTITGRLAGYMFQSMLRIDGVLIRSELSSITFLEGGKTPMGRTPWIVDGVWNFSLIPLHERICGGELDPPETNCINLWTGTLPDG